MKFPVALTLWKKSQKINCFYACQSFFYSLGLFLCLNILCVFTSCSRQNQIEELFEKWILVDEVIWQEMMENQQDTDISTYLQNVQFKKLINDYEDFRKTEFYQNLVISENYGEAMKNLDVIRVNRIDPAVYAPLQGAVSNKADAIAYLKKTAHGEGIFCPWNFINRKRWNQLDDMKETFSRDLLGTTYTLAPDSKMWIFPFPKNAINNNENLKQNNL